MTTKYTDDVLLQALCEQFEQDGWDIDASDPAAICARTTRNYGSGTIEVPLNEVVETFRKVCG